MQQEQRLAGFLYRKLEALERPGLHPLPHLILGAQEVVLSTPLHLNETVVPRGPRVSQMETRV